MLSRYCLICFHLAYHLQFLRINNWWNIHICCCTDKENFCLFAYPNGQWEVTLPAEDVPPELPEPTLGINFARDGMPPKDWLALVAAHSEGWLLSVAFYFAARFGFDKDDRCI